MDAIDAIRARRSIRRFREEPVAREVLMELLQAACLAPSPKNGQPWRFMVFTGERRAELAAAMRGGLGKRSEARSSAADLEQTVHAIEAAPAVVLVCMAGPEWSPRTRFEGPDRIADLQSIGACIENLSLAAVERGLGTLWICDILDAEEEVTRFARPPGQLVAAVAIGVPLATPPLRPRRPLQETVTWVE
jgi:nitroreductase